jgi:hypothetical protein
MQRRCGRCCTRSLRSGDEWQAAPGADGGEVLVPTIIRAAVSATLVIAIGALLVGSVRLPRALTMAPTRSLRRLDGQPGHAGDVDTRPARAAVR